jgi:hypothetical protein
MVLASGARDQVLLRYHLVRPSEILLHHKLTYYSDPFLKMIEANKTYGFTIAVKELKETVPNIFRYASAYKRVNNLTSQGLWEMFVEPQPEPKEVPEEEKHSLPEEILRGDPSHASIPDIDPEAMEGEKYNMCHFWSNFEIARLSWFRSKEYEDFFQMMDRSGGFWMERVRSCSLSWSSRVILTFFFFSGEMRQSTRLPPGLFLLPEIFITSVILGTDTPLFSIARPMRLHVKCPDHPSLRRRH